VFARGFTLIETIMVIMITAILSIAGIHIMKFVLGNSFYLPNQVQADLVAAEAIEIMVEGDAAAKGIRFCKNVTTAAANQVIVTNQDDEVISYRLDTGTGKLYRKIATEAEVMIPYYMASDMTLSGVGGTLFSYYDSADAVTATVADIRRINIDLIAKQGAGSSDNYQGLSQQSTSIKVNKYL
jgi:prepilin-type N-terminal cleavage/methylation domain-containing protein